MPFDTLERSVWMYRLIHLLVEYNDLCVSIPQGYKDTIECITQVDDEFLADLVTEMTQDLTDTFQR